MNKSKIVYSSGVQYSFKICTLMCTVCNTGISYFTVFMCKYVIFQQESIQAVYNWQFVQSLHLWTEVLGATANRPHLQPLLYPLVQVPLNYTKHFYCLVMTICVLLLTYSMVQSPS